MGGPWDKYAAQPQQSGPWDKYAPQQTEPAPTPQSPMPEGTISAINPQGWQQKASHYLDQLESDVRHGGTETLPGRLLKKLGAPGTDTGVSPEVANTVASPVLGPIKTAQGVVEGDPLKTVGGIAQTATLPAAFVAPEAANTAINKIPSRAYGAKLLASVADDANKVPVKIESASEPALRLMSWQQKTQLGPTINKFLNRITAGNKPQLTYEEAREFYQVLGRLSSNESNNLAPAAARDLKLMVNGLRTDIGNAAAEVGRQADYYTALKNYSQALKLRGIAANIGKYILLPAAGGAAVKGYSVLTK